MKDIKLFIRSMELKVTHEMVGRRGKKKDDNIIRAILPEPNSDLEFKQFKKRVYIVIQDITNMYSDKLDNELLRNLELIETATIKNIGLSNNYEKIIRDVERYQLLLKYIYNNISK